MAVAQILVYIIVATCVTLGVIVDVFYNPKGYSLQFRFRRLANWLPLSVSYAFFYIARYNITWIIDPRIAEKLQLSETQYGHVLTAGFWTYAVTAPFTGLVTDKQFGMKRGFYVGCFGSGITLLTMGLVFLSSDSFSASISTTLFALFNSVDFIFQGFATNGVSKINAAWYAPEERSLFGGIFSMITSTGLFINLIIGDFILNSYRFNYLFVITGVILVVCGVFVVFLVDTAPSNRWKADLMLRSEVPTSAPISAEDVKVITDMTIKDKFLVFFQDYIKPLCVSPIRYTMLGFIVVGYLRESLLTWFVRFLTNERGVQTGDVLYTVTSAGLSLASMGGAFLLGIISTLLFKSQYAPTITIFFGLLSGVTMLLLIKNATVTVALLLVYFVLLFGISNTLVFTVLMDFAKLKSVAFSGGLATTVQYIASGFSGFVNSFVISNYGFSAWITLLLPFGIAGTALMGIVAFEEYKKSKTQVQSVEIMMDERASLMEEATKDQAISSDETSV